MAFGRSTYAFAKSVPKTGVAVLYFFEAKRSVTTLSVLAPQCHILLLAGLGKRANLCLIIGPPSFFFCKCDIQNKAEVKYFYNRAVRNSDGKGTILPISADCRDSNVAQKNSKAWNLNLLPWNFYRMPWNFSSKGAKFCTAAAAYAHKWCICKTASLFAPRDCIIMQRVARVFCARGEDGRK